MQTNNTPSLRAAHGADFSQTPDNTSLSEQSTWHGAVSSVLEPLVGQSPRAVPNALPKPEFTALDVKALIELPHESVAFGASMSRMEFDSTMQGLSLTAAHVRHDPLEEREKSSFKTAVFELYQAVEGSRHRPNLSKAVEVEFFDENNQVLTKPQWTEFATMVDPLDGKGVYLLETHGHELGLHDPLNKE